MTDTTDESQNFATRTQLGVPSFHAPINKSATPKARGLFSRFSLSKKAYPETVTRLVVVVLFDFRHWEKLSVILHAIILF